MEDYIYILIGVIWIAASVYRASQKNKKKAPQQKQASSPAPSGERDDKPVRSLLEELFDGQQIRIPEPVVTEVEPEPEPVPPQASSDRKYTRSFEKEYSKVGFSSLEKVSREGSSSLNKYKQEKHKKKNKKKYTRPSPVDLRKAIIYKAILERPYS